MVLERNKPFYPTLKQQMESHLDQYVMKSQREVYLSVTGNQFSEESDKTST
jgi:hypothetical protein